MLPRIHGNGGTKTFERVGTESHILEVNSRFLAAFYEYTLTNTSIYPHRKFK